jgi:hypothetical protein
LVSITKHGYVRKFATFQPQDGEGRERRREAGRREREGEENQKHGLGFFF